MSAHHRSKKLIGAIAAIAVAFIGLPAAAQAACPVVPTAQKFKQFGDLAYYRLAPGGNFEAKSWTYVGSPSIITGNEPWKIGSSTDSRSISVPVGASAISPNICIGVDQPHFRFFARGGSGTWGTLYVKLRYTDPRTKKVVTNVAGSVDFSNSDRTWRVSPPMGIGNSLPIWGTQTIDVQIILEPTKISSGGWVVDDLYIDPYRK